MKRYILICSCFNQKRRASEAFCLLFPDEVLPEFIKGRDRIYKFAKSINNDHIEAISKLSGRFAYYVEFDDNNKITKEYDLTRCTRIA